MRKLNLSLCSCYKGKAKITQHKNLQYMHLHVIRIKRLIDKMNNCLAHGQKYLLKHGYNTILVLRNKLINQRYEVLQVSRLKII